MFQSSFYYSLTLITIVFSSFLTLHSSTYAETSTSHPITITNLKIRKPIPSTTTTSAYFVIKNHTQTVQQLTKVTCSCASSVEIHNHSFNKATQSMQMYKIDSLNIKPSSKIHFKPHGLHLMLFNLTQDPSITMTFHFLNAPSISITQPLVQ